MLSTHSKQQIFFSSLNSLPFSVISLNESTFASSIKSSSFFLLSVMLLQAQFRIFLLLNSWLPLLNVSHEEVSLQNSYDNNSMASKKKNFHYKFILLFYGFYDAPLTKQGLMEKYHLDGRGYSLLELTSKHLVLMSI